LPWLRRPWPYLGGVLALLIFTPNLAWQAQHDWMTFAFQFGRIGQGGYTLRYLAEFAGAQLGLASPLILLLGGIGVWRARAPDDDRFVLVAFIGTALIFFLLHALRDRVQGNWPAFVYPALAILAADATASSSEAAGHKKNLAPRWLVRPAALLAALLLAAVYAQAAFAILPIRHDPVARLLARDFLPAVDLLEKDAAHPDAIVTTDYETTALLRYYRPAWKVIQLNEPWRYPWAVSGRATGGTLVYLTENRREQPNLVPRYFRSLSAPLPLGVDMPYEFFLLKDPKAQPFGKMP
jgi:hypothetical protein